MELEIPIADRARLFLRLYHDLQETPYSQLTELALTIHVKTGATRITTDIPNRHEFESYLARFRQLILKGEACYLGALLELLPRHIADRDLRARLKAISVMWRAANEAAPPSQPTQTGVLQFDTRNDLVELVLYGGLFHSNPRLADVWDAIGDNERNAALHGLRTYESDVRAVAHKVKEVIEIAMARGLLGRPNATSDDGG